MEVDLGGRKVSDAGKFTHCVSFYSAGSTTGRALVSHRVVMAVFSHVQYAEKCARAMSEGNAINEYYVEEIDPPPLIKAFRNGEQISI
jgi:hypothetical protein